MQSQFHLGEGRLAEDANVLARLARAISQAHQVERQLLGVRNLPVAIHADGILRGEVTQLARFLGAGGDLGHADVQEHFLHVGEGVGFGIGGHRSMARSSISLVPPPAGIRPTPASTNPM